MGKLAQVGSRLAVALGLVACNTSQQPSGSERGDGGSRTQQQDAAPSDGGGQGSSCTLNQDCLLVPTGCCAGCEPTGANVRAVHKDEQRPSCGGVLCGPCPEPTPGSIRSQLRAACQGGACTVVDLRLDSSTSCTEDSDCEARSAGCCPGCDSDPSGWFAFRKGANDRTELECDPIPPCLACVPVDPPPVDCADDGHCAVRN